jgi:glyoxylate/hydroxypyruvate reductase A
MTPCPTLDELRARLPEAEVVFGWRIPPRLLAQAPHLRWLQLMGAGVEDLVAERRTMPPGLLVTRITGIFGPWIAEYVLAHVLGWVQDFSRSWSNQQARRWDKFTVRRAAGLRLGVAGLGSVGGEVARLAHAVGLRVLGFDLEPRVLPDGSPAASGRRGSEELLRFLGGLDVLSINLPLTAETERMFGAREFAALPRGSFVVNTARGRLLDQSALAEALSTGHLAGAALDVFEVEPLPAESPLWSLEGVTVTSHISGPSTPAEVVPIFAANYGRYLAGQRLQGLVDLERGY